MFIFNIVDRINSSWNLVCPDVNSVCVLLDKLNDDPDTESYRITSLCGGHIKDVGGYFGIMDNKGRKAI